ncbi:indolepyruvate ferredoxin oxidoreductase family protein [Pseudacidovorax sp. RU35E]|uniref:indolepyruvate ferredoxin oxidoreductase family protein n=1 Tax=Pseudacidovorax sp. RU35E TaxID=1907403 RepID=UPI000954E7C6|nr:indolepyruvate ferredoxin oxidoreductase family protein [Pseudacidovorax sp. RU35E]SIR47200.1 indolepyruvate ferredoxin oxidoreductase [Pseudacidovorax sp. RU35E]
MQATLERGHTTLQDRYTAPEGWFYMTGMQALVRLPLQQRLRDQAAGWNTGGYISGYRGSPMGRYDMELWNAQKALDEAGIVFRPGLNEDLAATAIWGAQYVGTFPGAKVDGVFGIWYGKGPGVDRSGDALRHGNLAGTSPKGGVLCLAGDDHGAKSSTVANFSDGIFMAVGMPLLYPSNTQELLDYGLHGIAMSRFSGCWVGMKVVTDVVEGGGSVYVAADAPQIVQPEVPSKPADPFGVGYHVRGFDTPLVQEERLYRHKHAAALAYARANGLNRITVNPPDASIGIVSAGKSWQDVLQALGNLGLDDERLRALGVRLLKVGLIWPLETGIVREFARGLSTVIVVEEKRPVLEDQIRSALYATPHAPRLIGKHVSGGVFDPEPGAVAFPNAAELAPGLIAQVIADVLRNALPDVGLPTIAPPPPKTAVPGGPMRAPSFCSGCPHNRSTRVPEGSRALAGIGCHTMAMLINPQQTTTVSHMGAEGVMWLGQQPFTHEKHVFANLGDGTYSHSGFLAIRQAVAAKVPITYKLLYNGFVSMTGGQPVESGLTPQQILAALAGEGVKKMAVVTDEPDRYQGVALPEGVAVHHRTQMEAVQRAFREHPDVSVILYDQPCATERRRLRKRGKWPDPDRRSFINPAVCEGCGDCGAASNCMSIEPLETELGRKRRINQASCNKDFSCVEGFCPSFVTVHGGKLAKSQGAARTKPEAPSWTAALPEPEIAPLTRTHAVLIGGIGGTGVVTIGQTLAVAAHLQGYYSSNLDITGLAQKYGAVNSHVHIAPRPEMLHATRIAAQAADTLIGCDLVVAAGDESISRLSPGRSRAVVCTDLVPTSDFARNPDWQLDADAMSARLRSVLGEQALLLDGQRLANALMGDPIAANMFMLGAAWQLGQIPLARAAIERAIELNGVAIPMNQQAFLWGRRAAHDLAAVQAIVGRAQPSQVISFMPRTLRSVQQIIEHRSGHLLAHTGPALAARYRGLVARVAAAESRLGRGEALTRAVAHNYHRLLAVKDEWEVARLYAHPDFEAALAREFEGDYTLRFHVGAWPFAKTDPSTGKAIKAEAGPWLLTAFRWMARLKGLRGTWLDPFRHSAERTLDRRLLAQYEADIEALLANLSAESQPIAAKLAALPAQIRGYGHVREAQAAKAAVVRDTLLADLAALSHPLARAA